MRIFLLVRNPLSRERNGPGTETEIECLQSRVGLIVLATPTKLALELLNPAGGVNKALFSGKYRVRIRGYITNHDLVFDSVDFFGLIGSTESGFGEEACAGGNVDEACRAVSRMSFFFHDQDMGRPKSTLTRFEAGVGFANNVNTTFPAHNLAIRVTTFKGLN